LKKLFSRFNKILTICLILLLFFTLISGIFLLITYGRIGVSKSDSKFKPPRQLSSVWASANPTIDFAVNNGKCFGELKFNDKTVNVQVLFDPGRGKYMSVEDYDAMVINNFKYSPKTQLFVGSCKFYEKKCVVTITESNVDGIKVGDKIVFERKNI